MNLIVKVDNNNLIGDSRLNCMPRESSRDPDIIVANRVDMKHFVTLRKKSNGNSPSIVMMGRKTRESIPARFRPFDQNINCIISTTLTLQDIGDTNGESVQIFSSVEQCGQWIIENYPHSRVNIIGGGQIYQYALQQGLVDTIYMTKLKADFVGDVYFPHLGENRIETEREEFAHHHFITYRKA